MNGSAHAFFMQGGDTLFSTTRRRLPSGVYYEAGELPHKGTRGIAWVIR